MRRKTIIILVFLTTYISSYASTVKWLVRPEYDAISYFNETIFKCKREGKCQLIALNGEKLLPFEVDSITDCSEGYAVLLDKTGTRYKVRGFFKEAGQKFVSVNGNYYSGMYTFFSEGLVAVADSATRQFGYLDTNGQVAIRFKYRKARPFIKGWASVEPAKQHQKTIYIDRNGKRLNIKGFHHGKVIMGSSFNSWGEALITYYGNDNAIINTNGQVVRHYERKENTIPVRACDFAFDENGMGCSAKKEVLPKFDTNITPFSNHQLFGYAIGEETLVPAQFTRAGRFADGCAIVTKDNKFGILLLVDGNFYTSLDGSNDVVQNKKEQPKFIYTLLTPSGIGQQVEVKFNDGDGNLHPIVLQDNKYTFSPAVEKNAEEFTVRAQVTADGLLLWDEEITQSLNNIRLVIDPPVCTTGYADGNDIVHVKSVITNKSEFAVNVSCYFSAKFPKDSKNSVASKAYSSAKIAPGGQKEFFVDLKILEAESVKVSISVKANQKQYGAKSSTLELKPFY